MQQVLNKSKLPKKVDLVSQCYDQNIEDKILDITNLVSNASLDDANINEVKGEIPSIINLASNVSLNAKISEFRTKMLYQIN